jgi:hypothetical protein
MGATQHWEPDGKMVRLTQWVNHGLNPDKPCVKGLYPKKKNNFFIVICFQNIVFKIVWQNSFKITMAINGTTKFASNAMILKKITTQSIKF